MAMTSLNISLPQSLKDYVEDQVSTRGYSTPSEYLRELLRPKEIPSQKQRAEEKLEALLLERLNSGSPIEITPDYWERKRTLLLERHNKKSATPQDSE